MLHPPEQEQVVYRNNTPLKNPQRKNLNRFSPIGVYRVTNHQDRYLSHTNLRFKFSTKPEVNIGNEFLLAKETRLQYSIHLGPKSYKRMNSNFTIKETGEMPAQIFESDTETQEKNEAKKPAQDQGPAQAQKPVQVQENQKLEVPATVAPSSQDPPEETLKYFSCGKCGQGFKTPGEVEIHWDKPCSPNHGIPGNFRYHQFNPEGDTPITGPEEPSEISPDANAESPEPSKANTREGDTAAKDANYLVLNPIVSTQTGAIEPKPGHESAQEQSETPLREATPGLAPGREAEELVPESHSASNQDPRPDSRNEESQEEVLTKTKSYEWARIEKLDHEAIRSVAMAKTAETAKEKANKTKKERGKQNPPVDRTHAKEATPGSAPGGETVEQAPERSNSDFLTVDESGDVVNATWSDTPPKNENYQNNQRILGERIRNKKKS